MNSLSWPQQLGRSQSKKQKVASRSSPLGENLNQLYIIYSVIMIIRQVPPHNGGLWGGPCPLTRGGRTEQRALCVVSVIRAGPVPATLFKCKWASFRNINVSQPRWGGAGDMRDERGKMPHRCRIDSIWFDWFKTLLGSFRCRLIN